MSQDSTSTHVWIKDIKEEDEVKDCYLVTQKGMGITRVGKPFINMVLADRTGQLEAKVWDRAEQLSLLFQEGRIIRIKGRAGAYRGQIQITVADIEIPQTEIDPALFLESSERDPAEMMRSLRKVLLTVENSHLKALNERFLSDKTFVSQFKRAPAAKNFHHNYLGGLLEHTLSVCVAAAEIAKHYPQLDKDLLLTAALLHDVGKIREFGYETHVDYTDEGRLLGHLVLGAAMVDEKLAGLSNFPQALALRLKHMILSHHGEYEFGSPKRPKFLEAIALHLLDDLDAKVNGLGRFMEKDQQEGAWTDFNRMFGRHFLKDNPIPVETEPDSKDQQNHRQGYLFSMDSDT